MTPHATPPVGICILNYHHPVETGACVQRLREREGPHARILWLENDAKRTGTQAQDTLQGLDIPFQILEPEAKVLPPAGTVGLILNHENLGYAGGNNVGLRLLARAGVPYGWVMNNDTLLQEGSSADLLAAAQARPEVAAWGTRIVTPVTHYFGGVLKLDDFAITFAQDVATLEAQPHAYVSGCSLFMDLPKAAAIGFIPEEYFLYYEDPAFSLELKRAGHAISGVETVVVWHHESLSTRRRSHLTEYYTRRNRWFFIQKYFPDHLAPQKRRIWYTLQKWVFRARVDRLRIEVMAWLDFKAQRQGRSHRVLPRDRNA